MMGTNEIRAEFDAWFDGGNYAWGDHSSTAIALAFAAWQASRESLIAESKRNAIRLEVSEDTRQVIRNCLSTAESEIDQLKATIDSLNHVREALQQSLADAERRNSAPDIEAAAKMMAACMDYPWEHMPEQGRVSMREHAKAVIGAAMTKGPGSNEA